MQSRGNNSTFAQKGPHGLIFGRSQSNGGIVLVTNGSAVKGAPKSIPLRNPCHNNTLKLSTDDQIRCNRSTVMKNSCSNLDFANNKNESSSDIPESPDQGCELKQYTLSTLNETYEMLNEQPIEMD